MMQNFQVSAGISRGGGQQDASMNRSNGANMSANECPICCNLFRSPKCLQCGHTICVDCCQRLGNEGLIECPQCRQITVIPDEGLPTNYALLESLNVINQLTTARVAGTVKPYSCLECNRPCTAEEAWLCKRAECIKGRNCNAILLCSRCIIAKHADHGKNGSQLESLSDTLIQFEGMVNTLKQEVEAEAEQQHLWNMEVKKSICEINACANEVMDTCKRLIQSARNDVQQVEQEYFAVRQSASLLNLSDPRFDVLNGVPRTVQDVRKKIKQLVSFRKNTIGRLGSAMESLRIGLDCILKIESGEVNDAVVSQPQQHQQQLMPIPPRPKSPKPIPAPIGTSFPQTRQQQQHQQQQIMQAPARQSSPIRSMAPINFGLELDADNESSLVTPSREQQPRLPQPTGIQRQQVPAPPRANNVQHRNQQHDTTLPAAPRLPRTSSSSSSMNVNLNQSSFSIASTPRCSSTPWSSPRMPGADGVPGFGSSTVRRGPRSTVGGVAHAVPTTAAAGFDFYRGNRGGAYRK